MLNPISATKQNKEKMGKAKIKKKIEGYEKQLEEHIKKFKEAEKIYFVVKEHYTTLAKRQEEERRKLHRELTAINKELITQLDVVKKDMDQKGMIIRDLLTKAQQFMQQGNIEKANQLYLEVRQIFRQIPDAFAEQKMMLENQILTFYSQLVNEFNRKKYDKLLEKRDEIMRHVEMATNLLRIGKIEQAKKEYNFINNLYNQLPEGFMYEKSIIYKRILALFQLAEEGGIHNVNAPEVIPDMQSVKQPEKKEKTEQASSKEETKTKKGMMDFLKKKEEMDAPPLPI